MSIKTLALAAATVAATASVANADTYFSFGESLDRSSTLELGLIRAESNGVLEIYDERAGGLGQLLGTEELRAGANSDVRINLGTAPLSDVIAVIRVDGQIVETKEYEVN